jgi:hypothetical protein
MASKPTYDELLTRLDAVEKLLSSPSALKQRLEFGWDPRGGEPRIIDEDGHTLDYQGAIQLMGGTATIDPQEHRVIYTPTAAGSASYEFSPDDATSSTEMVEFRRPADNVLQAALRTRTNDTAFFVRDLFLVNASNGVATAGVAESGRYGRLHLRTNTGAADGTPDIASLEARTSANEATNLIMESRPAASSNNATLLASRTDGACDVELRSTAGAQDIRFVLNATAGGATSSATVAGKRLWDTASSSSQFMQLDDHLSGTAPLRRVMRGPFKVDVAALAAGATMTATPQLDSGAAALEMRNGADCVVMGSVVGASGSEALLWSYALGPAAGNITVSVTNVSGGALTAQLRLYVVSVS